MLTAEFMSNNPNVCLVWTCSVLKSVMRWLLLWLLLWIFCDFFVTWGYINKDWLVELDQQIHRGCHTHCPLALHTAGEEEQLHQDVCWLQLSIQHNLIMKLTGKPTLIWILDFLSSRARPVLIGCHTSYMLVLNTRALSSNPGFPLRSWWNSSQHRSGWRGCFGLLTVTILT